MKIVFIAILALAMGSASVDLNDESLLHRTNERISSKLLNVQVQAFPKDNLVLSGFSLLTPLAQLALAADESSSSHAELLRALSFSNDSSILDVFNYMNRNLRVVKGVEVRMGSRIYIPEDYNLNLKYQITARHLFGTDVANVDFKKRYSTAVSINNWVFLETNGHIKDMVRPNRISPDTHALLINAIYFKGKWNNRFDPEFTALRNFYPYGNGLFAKKIPTMAKQGYFDYGESNELDAKILKMYYEGLEAYMLIVLPNRLDGLLSLVEKLTDPNAICRAIKNLSVNQVNILLPKFKIQTETNLVRFLISIGVQSVFKPRKAKLSRMLQESEANSDLYVSDVYQKATIEVDEEGFKESAANVNIVATSSANGEQESQRIVDFHADRPFYFDVRVDQNDISLFSGIFAGRTILK